MTVTHHGSAAVATGAALDATVLEAVQDGVVVLDGDGRLVAANAAARAVAGWSSDPTGDTVLARRWELVTVDGTPIDDRDTPLARALRGETVDGVVVRWRADGHDDRWLRLSAAPIPTACGTGHAGAVGTFRDVTDELAAAADGRTAMVQLTAAIDGLPAGVAVYRPGAVPGTWTVDYANAAARHRLGDRGQVAAGHPAAQSADDAWVGPGRFAARTDTVDGHPVQYRSARVGDRVVQTITDPIVDAHSADGYRTTLDSFTDPVHLAAPVFDGDELVDVTFLFANEVAVNLHPHPGGHVGRTATELFPDNERVRPALRRAWEAPGEVHTATIDNLDRPEPGLPDYYVNIRARRIGDLLLIVGIDLTDVERARRALAAGEARFRSTLDALFYPAHLSAPIFDDDGLLVDATIEYANAAALDAQPGVAHVGATAGSVFPNWDRFSVAFDQAWQAPGDTVTVDVDNLDGRVDGIPTAYLVVRVRRVGDLLLSVANDLSDRERSRRAIVASEARYRGVVEAVADGLAIVDHDGRIQSVNPAGMAVFDGLFDPTGSHVTEFPFPMRDVDGTDVHPETLPGAVALRHRRRSDQLLAYTGRDGADRWLQVTAVPVDDADDAGTVVVFRDVTDEREMSAALAVSERRHRETVDRLPDPLLELVPVLDDGEIVGLDPVYVNPAGAALDPERLVPLLVGGARRVWGTDDTDVVEYRDGTATWQVKLSTAGDVIVAVARDVTETAVRVDTLARAAVTDPRTGLGHRQLLEDAIATTMAANTGGRSAAVFAVRLPWLERQQAAYGFGATSAVAASCAARLQQWAERTAAVVAQVNDTTFGVLVDGVTRVAEAERAAASLVADLRHDVVVDGQPVPVAVTVGVALAPLHGERADTVLRRACAASFAAAIGSRSVTVWEPGRFSGTRDLLDLAGRFADAVSGGELSLEYHPRYRVDDGAFVGFEACAVWTHPDRGRLPERAFLSALTDPTAWRRYATWATATALQATADILPDGCRVGVNLPTVAATDPDLLTVTTDALLGGGVSGDRLALEFGDRGAGRSVNPDVDVCAGLRDLAVAVHLDEFGAGPSGLIAVRLPLDAVNLDRSLTRNLARDPISQQVVAGCVGAAHAAGLTVTVTGVETAADAAMAATLGCDTAQGFWYSRPVTEGSFRAGWVPGPLADRR